MPTPPCHPACSAKTAPEFGSNRSSQACWKDGHEIAGHSGEYVGHSTVSDSVPATSTHKRQNEEVDFLYIRELLAGSRICTQVYAHMTHMSQHKREIIGSLVQHVHSGASGKLQRNDSHPMPLWMWNGYERLLLRHFRNFLPSLPLPSLPFPINSSKPALLMSLLWLEGARYAHFEQTH